MEPWAALYPQTWAAYEQFLLDREREPSGESVIDSTAAGQAFAYLVAHEYDFGTEQESGFAYTVYDILKWTMNNDPGGVHSGSYKSGYDDGYEQYAKELEDGE